MLRHSLCGIVPTLALICSAPAAAQGQGGLTLPPAPLADSLNALSRMAGVEILAVPALLRGRRAPAVHAAPDARTALRALLRGSGLTFEEHGGTLLIVQAKTAAPARRPALETRRPRSRPARPPAQPSPPEGTAIPEMEIVVTGTRIMRPDLVSAMPISAVDMADAARVGRVSAYDALMLHPAAGPGIGLFNTQSEPWDAGASFINLRNMGTNRSLTLIDGMRRVSGSARSSAVDINLIPGAMIERIDILTGGAAAIYGADAVTGAINLIMKKDLTGLRLSAVNGISQAGDANEHSVSLATGASFAGGRGAFMIGGTYTRTAPLGYSDRYANRIFYHANPASANSSDGVPDNILDHDFRTLYRSAYPVYYVDGQFYILRDGLLSPTVFDRTHTSGELGSGSGGPGSTAFENHFLRAELHAAALTARLRFDLTPTLRWQAYLDHGHTYSASATVFPEIRTDSRPHWFDNAGGEVATLDNPFLPASLRAFMLARGLTSLKQNRSWFIFDQPLEIHRRDSVTLGTSIDRRLPGGLNWSVFLQYGQGIDHVETTNIAKKTQWLQARDVIADPVTGQPVCRDAAARAAGCVPLDMFSTAPASDALAAYVLGTRREWRRNAQYIAGGNLGGPLFSLPHGEASIVLGAEWRRDILSTRDDPDPANLANLVYLGVDYILHPALDAARETSEAYGELVLPLLADMPLARRLAVEGAYRVSHYSDNGLSTQAWKIGATWEPLDGLTLRGVRSRSVRIPNFGELYAPVIRSQLGIIPDPCNATYINQGANRPRNCAALGITTPLLANYTDGPLIVTGGNPDLVPEISNSFTLGGVLRPAWLPGFEASVDYWNIRIENVITQFSYIMIMNLCVDSATIDNIFCGLQTRDPASGHVHQVSSFNVNVAHMTASGVDMAARYRRELGAGELRVDLLGTYLLDNTTVTAPGALSGRVAYAGEYDYPRFRATMMASYALGRLSIALGTRFISRSLYSTTDPSPETRDPSHVPPYLYNDLSIEFRPTEKYRLTLGVRNISNAGIFGPLRDISPGPNVSGNNTGSAYYDPIGRYVFARIEASL